MIEKGRFSLNRICSPSLGLEEFFRLAVEAGISKVELRNDLPGGRVTDALSASRARSLAQASGIRIIALNALQKFNLKSARKQAEDELKRLLDLAAELGCPALVLCPNNDTADRRDATARLSETTDALKAFAPPFEKSGILGYVEPLGFPESSLSSILVAMQAIKSSGASCYRALYDTFHHFLGPETEKDIGPKYHVSDTGLIHVSGVESGLLKEKYRDEHRVLPGPKDRSFCKEQIARHVRLGYTGDISLEPFSPDVQRMGRKELAEALRASTAYLSE